MRKLLNSVLVSIMFALIACKGSVSVDSPEAETILYDPDSTAVLKADDESNPILLVFTFK